MKDMPTVRHFRLKAEVKTLTHTVVLPTGWGRQQIHRRYKSSRELGYQIVPNMLPAEEKRAVKLRLLHEVGAYLDGLENMEEVVE